jgi:hypothetical protein
MYSAPDPYRFSAFLLRHQILGPLAKKIKKKLNKHRVDKNILAQHYELTKKAKVHFNAK